MKQKILKGLVFISIALAAHQAKAQYIDLATGKQVTLVKNEMNGIMYNPETQRPAYLYINPTTNDTFYGRTGVIVNGQVYKQANGTYVYTGDSSYVFSNGEFRLRQESDNYEKRFDRDGDVILKGKDFKKKTELDGDIKVKNGQAKVKEEGNGVLKVKDGTYKKKIDSEGNYLEKDSTFKAKAKVDGSMKVKDRNRDYKGKVNEEGKLKEKNSEAKGKLKPGGKIKVKSEGEKIKVNQEGETKVKTNQ